MIPKGELFALRGEWSLTDEIIEKDYVLGWLLAGIAAEPALRDHWVFKGGTALRKCYFETYRFSEDLDFTVPRGGPEDPVDLASLSARFHLATGSPRTAPGRRRNDTGCPPMPLLLAVPGAVLFMLLDLVLFWFSDGEGSPADRVPRVLLPPSEIGINPLTSSAVPVDHSSESCLEASLVSWSFHPHCLTRVDTFRGGANRHRCCESNHAWLVLPLEWHGVQARVTPLSAEGAPSSRHCCR